MKLVAEPVRQKVGRFLQRTFKPEVSANRQVVASSLAAVALIIAWFIYGRFDYAYCHFLAGMGITWVVYTLSGSPRLGVLFTVLSSMYNELVVDLAKPGHPNVDWDQLVAGFVGAALGYWVLAALRRRWPGRAWNLGV